MRWRLKSSFNSLFGYRRVCRPKTCARRRAERTTVLIIQPEICSGALEYDFLSVRNATQKLPKYWTTLETRTFNWRVRGFRCYGLNAMQPITICQNLLRK